MAERKKTKRRSGPKKTRRSVPVRRRRTDLFARFRKPRAEFREDASGTALVKLLHVTEQQRLHLLRWVLYIVVCLGALVVQDVIMSRLRPLGATTDLAPAAIILIAVLEGSEVGSVFALLTSVVYYFSGTAPGAYSVGFITALSLVLGLFRQKYLHRSAGSIIICAGAAVFLYEIGIFAAGISLGLTRWGRLFYFVLSGIYSAAVMIPLYFLVHRIGLIGGNQWKE